MRDLPVERIAVIAGTPGALIQDLLAALTERRSPALRIAGVVAETHGLPDRTCSAGYLRRLANGERFAMFGDLGPGSTVCHLEGDGVVRAAEAVRQDMAAGCDLVVLSKFGKLEAAGEGLWSAFAAAVDARVPLLTSVSPAAAMAWEAVAGTRFVTLPPDDAAVDSWLDAVVRLAAVEAPRLRDVQVALPAETAALSSPACFAHEMDDRYMGFASRDELLRTLNELLEAERAGARVTLRTVAEAPDDVRPLIMAIHRDEARWCGVLTKAIDRLRGTPTAKTGAFYDKAMAIADIPARLAFLNRGQGWVVRKLKTLLATIRDDAIHADLAAMLASHEQNIGLVAAKLPAPHSEGGAA